MSLSLNLWPSLLPPVCNSVWFTADQPKNEEAELAKLEEEIEQEKTALKEQGPDLQVERLATEANEDEQDYEETEDDSYMGIK